VVLVLNEMFIHLPAKVLFLILLLFSNVSFVARTRLITTCPFYVFFPSLLAIFPPLIWHTQRARRSLFFLSLRLAGVLLWFPFFFTLR